MSQKRKMLSAGGVIRAGDMVRGRVLGDVTAGRLVDQLPQADQSQLVIEPDYDEAPAMAIFGRYESNCFLADHAMA